MRYFFLISLFFSFAINLSANHENYYYAALAYSPSTNTYGYANNQYSPYTAINLARSWCRGYDCYSGVVQNGCIALATSYNRGFGLGSGWNYQAAYWNAMSYCQQSGVPCSVQVWECTVGHG